MPTRQDLTPNKPQFHSVWNYNWFKPEMWTNWIDIQTNPPPQLPENDQRDWSRFTPLKIISPETMVEMLK